jgi:uncharacterized protein YdhG (YjbR/CyaY superfamily)
MVRSDADDVATYLAELPADRRNALTAMRRLCQQELAGFDETMAYGMPTYRKGGVAQVAFASQRNYISIYLMRADVREAFAERLAGHDMGKGCLRFRRADAIDFGLLRDLLRATAARPGTVC